MLFLNSQISIGISNYIKALSDGELSDISSCIDNVSGNITSKENAIGNEVNYDNIIAEYNAELKTLNASYKIKKHNVFYVDKDIYELGLTEVKTPMGNNVRVYDVERCICDIIRSKNRMDSEHIKHSVKEYIKKKDNIKYFYTKYYLFLSSPLLTLATYTLPTIITAPITCCTVKLSRTINTPATMEITVVKFANNDASETVT